MSRNYGGHPRRHSFPAAFRTICRRSMAYSDEELIKIDRLFDYQLVRSAFVVPFSLRPF
jgi:hypothetical protein